MKLSYAISYESTTFGAIGQGNWKVIGKKMVDLGYQGIELGVKNPFTFDVNDVKKFLSATSLKLVAMGTGQVYFDGGCSLSSFDKEKRDKAFDYLLKYFEIAAQLDTLVIVGLIRGRLSDHTNKDEALSLWESNIRRLTSLAVQTGIYIVIEPINRYETDYLNTVHETIAYIEQHNLKNTGLLFDTFHANIEESSFAEAIRAAKPFLKHIHFADSNRNFPGSGHIDFANILKVAEEIGYDGFFSGEMRPYPDLDTSIENYIAFMNRLSYSPVR